MSNTFFIADTHFGHANILEYEPEYRGSRFANVQEMDEHMVQEWNKTVSPQDTVYHLGDVAFALNGEGSVAIRHLLDRLHGKKILIPGNHDNFLMNCNNLAGFDGVHGMLKLGRQYILTHCPMHHDELEMYPGYKNVHGHLHSRLVFQHHSHRLPDPAYINVGVELADFTPVPLEELEKYQTRIINNLSIIQSAINKENRDLLAARQRRTV